MQSHKHTDDTRLALLEQSIKNINETMLRIENRFDRLENKVDDGFKKVNEKIDDTYKTLSSKIDDTYKTLNNRLWTNFLWIMGTYVGGFASIYTLVQYLTHK